MPVLTVVAEKDDLVTPDSTLELEKYISSNQKKTLTHKGGHVGLCISTSAQQTLWPQIAKWLQENYQIDSNFEKPERTEKTISVTV